MFNSNIRVLRVQTQNRNNRHSPVDDISKAQPSKKQQPIVEKKSNQHTSFCGPIPWHRVFKSNLLKVVTKETLRVISIEEYTTGLFTETISKVSRIFHRVKSCFPVSTN